MYIEAGWKAVGHENIGTRPSNIAVMTSSTHQIMSRYTIQSFTTK